ncbi:ABC transporter permease [Spiroplasma monobiae]|uniref:ABC transporter permease n=1 Tax=Spiroplasma monobiae (strain ATCC 33825 / MQ-1) TaxID=2136 RepID=UPI001315ADBB|nr:ABC transporter permease [Spiroplasma monobiae]
MSVTKRINEDYNNAMSKMNPFSYVDSKTIGTNTSEELGLNIIAPMDILNNEFLYVKDSNDPNNENKNKAIDINYNISSFENPKYSETFLTRTFEDAAVEEKFLNTLENPAYWFSIFDYKYDATKDVVSWDPFFHINWYANVTTYQILDSSQPAPASASFKDFYLFTIEKLKEEYLKDLFDEDTPNYLKNTLFFELKDKKIISMNNFEGKIQDNSDNDIYNRYLYFALETFIRQLLRSTTEYPAYWINEVISTMNGEKDREILISEFNKKESEIGFQFLCYSDDCGSFQTSEENSKAFASTIFTWIFGRSPKISGYENDNLNSEFIVSNNNGPWDNSFNYFEPEGNYLNSRNEVFKKGMRGSFTQLVISGNQKSVDKTFNTKYLRHFENSSVDNILGHNADMSDLDNYKKYRYEEINFIRGYFLKQEILADAFDFDYEARAEVEFTDNISEVTYRIVDIETDWKDKITLYEGNMPRTKNEILINNQFAKANNYKIGENIKIGGNNFVISGFATEPLTYYPMGNTMNPLPNSKKSAIVYANKQNLDQIITNDLSKTATKTMYSLLTFKGNNKKDMQYSIDNFRAYSFSNISEVYDSYSFITSETPNLIENRLIDNYKNFDSSTLKLNWTMAPKIISIFKIFVYIFCVLIFVITITATIIAVKKTVELNSGEIGILKAMGAKSWEISSSYLAYGFVVAIFIAPFAWILGSIIQEYMAKIFLQFVGGTTNLVYFSPLALTISILIFGLLLCIISFLTAYNLIRRPTLEIINKVNNIKRIEWMDNTKNWIVRKRSFSWRFSLELAISGFSKTILSALTVFFAGFLVSFGLTIPGMVQNVVGSYYKNVYYSNSFANREVMGNAPLSKTSLSATKPIDDYENNLFDSKSIFGEGINMISKNITDFAPSPDSSAIPQILLSKSNEELTAKWIYETITDDSTISTKSNYSEQNSLISIISSLLGNNISQLVGKGVSIADIQKIIEWVIHSESEEFKNDIDSRVKKIDEISGLLTNGLPTLLTNFIKGSSTTDGEWKEQIVNIIISQTPAYLKQYVTRSENRLNNFEFGWQINKYIPGVDSFYTKLNLSTKNKLSTEITGVQKTQSAYKINEANLEKTFMSDYQALQLKMLLNGENPDKIDLESIKGFYDEKNHEILVPVISNQQAEFDLENNWSKLDNPTINKSRLVLRNGNVNIPNEAWMYDDGDWLKNENKLKNDENHGYIEMTDLSASKFTYAPVFEKTGFNLINVEENHLMDNSYGFYNLTSNPTIDGEELNLEVRPYYSYDNVTMFFPAFYKEDFEKLMNKGNRDTSKWFKDGSDVKGFVPETTKKAWSKIDKSFENTEWFAIKPYSYYYDQSGSYRRESQNLSGEPIESITNGFENFYSRTLRDNDGPITFGNSNMNWKNENVNKISFHKSGSIEVYGSSIILADQNIINLLSGYGISKYVPFNLKYEDSLGEGYSYKGVDINTYNYLDPINYYKDEAKNNSKELVFGKNDFERSIRPSSWYTGMYSNAEEPYFITTQASFSRDKISGTDTINGSNYGASALQLESTKLLSQQKTLIFQLSAIVLILSSIAISLLIIVMILTITLINDLYVNQYRRFMVVMKSIGYSNWNIIKYTFGTMTVLSTIFYGLGVMLNFFVILILFNIISKNLGSIPFGFAWWTPILAIILVMGSFVISIAITTREVRKVAPSLLMR